jgi:hypothetical protein
METLFYPATLYSQGRISIHSRYRMPERSIAEGGAKRHSHGPLGTDIHDPESELPRTPIPRTRVNREACG